MRNRTRWLLVAATAAVVVLGTGGAAAVAARGEEDQTLRGTSLERATEAALALTGGGSVTDAEVGDGGAAYSVEVRLDTGGQVEVSLDSEYRVIGQEADEDGAGEADQPGTD